MNLYLVSHGNDTFLVRAASVADALRLVHEKMPGRSYPSTEEDVRRVLPDGPEEVIAHFLE